MKKIAMVLCVALAATAHCWGAETSHNIFDDDWTVPALPEKNTGPTLTDPAPAAPPANATPTEPKPPGGAAPAPSPPGVTPPSAPSPAVRLAVPTRSQQAPVRVMLKQLYAKELADRTATGQRALASKLLRTAKESSAAPVDQFVLLSAAFRASVGAGDLLLAIEGAEQMSSAFEVDGVDLETEAAVKIGPRKLPPNVQGKNLSAAVDLARKLLVTNRLVSASKVCASFQAQSGADPELRLSMQQEQKTINERRAAIDRYAQDSKKLITSPDDSSLNLSVGKYLCLIGEQWSEGLPVLARGSDPVLQKLAAADLAAMTPEKRFAAADAWWDESLKPSNAGWRVAAQKHAADLYEPNLDKLSSLRRTLASSRLFQVRVADPALFSDLLSKMHGIGLDVANRPVILKQYQKLEMPELIPNPGTIRMVLQVEGAVTLRVWDGGGGVDLIGGLDEVKVSIPMPRPTPAVTGGGFGPNKWATVDLAINGNHVIVFVDGQKSVETDWLGKPIAGLQIYNAIQPGTVQIKSIVLIRCVP